MFVGTLWRVCFVVGWMVHFVGDLVMRWVMRVVVWVVAPVHDVMFLLFIFALTIIKVVHWVMRVLSIMCHAVIRQVEVVRVGMHAAVMVVVVVEKAVRWSVMRSTVVHKAVRVVIHEAGRWSEVHEVRLSVHGTVSLRHAALTLGVHLIHH